MKKGTRPGRGRSLIAGASDSSGTGAGADPPDARKRPGQRHDDDHLRELGALLWQIRELFPIDEIPPPDSALLLDAEWKLRPDDTLLIEQVRPYLRRE